MPEQATIEQPQETPEVTPAEQPSNNEAELPPWALAELKRARNEAATYRVKLREAEPIVAKHREAEEAQKSELQKITEAQRAAEQARDAALTEALRLRIAVRNGIGEDDFDLLGTGTEEEIEARAKRIAEKNAAAAKPAEIPPTTPPSDKPVEKLRPGATPTETPLGEQDAYPAHWLPPRRAS